MTRTHRGRRSHEVVRRAGDMAAGPGARAGGVTCAAVVPWLVRTARSVGRRSRAEATSGAHAAKPLGSPPRRRGAHYRPRAGTAFCSWPSFCSWSPWRWRRLRGVPFSAWCSGSWCCRWASCGSGPGRSSAHLGVTPSTPLLDHNHRTEFERLTENDDVSRTAHRRSPARNRRRVRRRTSLVDPTGNADIPRRSRLRHAVLSSW